MSIKIRKSELWKAIQGLGKVVSGKETLPILSCVRLRSHEGNVSVTGTNLEELIVYRFKESECSVKDDFIIMYDGLRKLIHDGSEGSIVFQPCRDNLVEVVMEAKGKRLSRLFKMEKPEDWPQELPIVEKMEPVSSSVFHWIRSVIPSAADPKDTRRTLQSVYLERTGMTATNGRELAHVECKLPVDDMIVPVTKALTSALFEKDGFMGATSDKDKRHLCIKCDGFTYLVRCRPDTYPNFRQAIPKEKDLRMKVEFPDWTVKEILSRIALLPVKGEHESAVLYAGKHGVHIFSDDDSAPVVLNTEGEASSDEDCFIKFNRSQFVRALSLFHTQFGFNEGSPIVAKGVFPGYYVFMPVKGKDINKEKLLSLIRDRTNPAKEETVNARTAETAPQTATATAPRPVEQKPPFQVVGGKLENGEVFEEAASAVETLKASIKAIYDGVADLQRKLKDAKKAIKNKEREYQSTKQLITKLRTASGF